MWLSQRAVLCCSQVAFCISILFVVNRSFFSQAASASVARTEGMLIDCVSEIRRDLVSVSAGNSTAALPPCTVHLTCPDDWFCRRPSSSCSVIGACSAKRPQPARVPEHADAGDNRRTPLRVACERVMLLAAARCPGPQQTRQNYGEGKFDVDRARCSKKENSPSRKFTRGECIARSIIQNACI